MTPYTDNKVRISIDVAMFVSLLFSFGTLWQKVNTLEKHVAELQAEVLTSNDLRLEGYQRLTRVEVKLDNVISQLDRISRRIDDESDKPGVIKR